MTYKSDRPMTRSLRKTSIQDAVFATPSVPASRLRKRFPTRSAPKDQIDLKFPSFSISPSSNSTTSDNISTKPSHFRLSLPPSSFSSNKQFTSTGYFTTPPSTKLVKPDPVAFSTSGLLTKKNQLKDESTNKFFTPETPCKKNSLLFNNNTTQSSAPPSFGLGNYSLENSPYQLGKHRNSNVELNVINKRRYLSPSDNYQDSLFSPLKEKSDISSISPNSYLSKFFPGENISNLSDDFFNDDSTKKINSRGLMSNFVSLEANNRDRSNSFATSEIGTSFSTTSTLPTGFPRLDLSSRDDPYNFNTADFMQCESLEKNNLPSLEKSDSMNINDSGNNSPGRSSSPMLIIDERPQMPQIVGGFATNYPHFLNRDYFTESSKSSGFPFLPPLADHSPVDEAGYLDYYRYQFDEIMILGKGNFSTVLLSRNLEDGKTYAMKKSSRPFSGRRDRIRKLSEVEILWKLKGHPNVVEIFGSWEQFGFLYIQYELCELGSLNNFLSNLFGSDPVPEEDIWRIIAEISSGISHIHNQDILHLDLNPANIVVSSSGHLKIADFGHSSFLPVSGNDHEGDRTYLAPEILESGSYQKPNDIFSLGLIILEIAANVVLPENGPEWFDLRHNNLTSAQLDKTEVSSDLFSIISCMLDKDPKNRPTADQILSFPRVHDCIGQPITLPSNTSI
ncbi:Mitosis inhibitor protein kinase wee1 [Smittium mucronatum]|uniref:Mitosis inhibitor protein kinase wee1 n=1 Tax=Smittium mucronatum TaxID=133383 RepID=A0A1R0H825_9FUNG|nr:Mitosis inhibitor protein kinase wee1 [Smittium mucronatum]